MVCRQRLPAILPAAEATTATATTTPNNHTSLFNPYSPAASISTALPDPFYLQTVMQVNTVFMWPMVAVLASAVYISGSSSNAAPGEL
jgi:hypothetical protein